MTDWQAELDALMRETMRLTKSAGVQPVIPRAVIASHRMSPVTLNSSERDQIRRRVANFKAHQERFAREVWVVGQLIRRMIPARIIAR